jgi:hypothetical protein
MNDESHNSGSGGGGVPVIRVALGALLLLGAVWFAYVRHRPEPLADGARNDEQRSAALAKLHAKEHALARTYTWVDKEKGIVRLPLDHAIALTIEELNAAKK